MRSLALATALCLALFVTAFAQEAVETKVAPAGGTVKITAAPAVKHVGAVTAATAFTKAADYAPEGGYADTDISKACVAMVTNGMTRLGDWMKKTNATPAGPFFSIWYEDPSKVKPGDLTSKQGFPISGKYDPIPGVVIEDMPEADVATITYMGAYDNSMNAWNDLMKFIEKEGYVYAGAPMEIYLVGPDKTQNPDEYLTEVQWPVKKAETAPDVAPKK